MIVILTLLASWQLQAEYRVYQYMVKSAYPLTQESTSYVVTSSLSPNSYVAYHGGEDVIRVSLLRSWMCKGSTGGGKSPCKAPLESMDAATKEASKREAGNVVSNRPGDTE
jgi:hypothetical protein